MIVNYCSYKAMWRKSASTVRLEQNGLVAVEHGNGGFTQIMAVFPLESIATWKILCDCNKSVRSHGNWSAMVGIVRPWSRSDKRQDDEMSPKSGWLTTLLNKSLDIGKDTLCMHGDLSSTNEATELRDTRAVPVDVWLKTDHPPHKRDKVAVKFKWVECSLQNHRRLTITVEQRVPEVGPKELQTYSVDIGTREGWFPFVAGANTTFSFET